MNTFSNQKSLADEVNEIISEKSSKRVKAEKLIKLGLTQSDVHVILDNVKSSVKSITFESLTFGIEIECSCCNSHNLIEKATARGLNIRCEGYNHDDSKKLFKIVSDGSLRGEDTNEIVTPILKGKKGVNDLKTLCDTFREINASVNSSCGLHIHVGSKKMTNEWYINIFRTYKYCKRVIDTFLAPSRRGEYSTWCKGLNDYDFSTCNSIEDVRRLLNYDRYHCVNAEAYQRHNTIEFRQHQGTTDYEKISNWLAFVTRLVVWSYDNKLNEYITSIDEIPFITDGMKRYLKGRKASFEA